MRFISRNFWILPLMLTVGCLKPSNPIKVAPGVDLNVSRKIAVLDFAFEPAQVTLPSESGGIEVGHRRPEEEEKPGTVMADAIAHALAAKRLYEVVEREELEDLEQPASAEPTNEQLAPLVQKLGVDGFVVGTVTECAVWSESACCSLVNDIEIRAEVRLVSVAGDEIWSTSMQLREDGTVWERAMQRFAMRLADALDERLPGT